MPLDGCLRRLLGWEAEVEAREQPPASIVPFPASGALRVSPGPDGDPNMTTAWAPSRGGPGDPLYRPVECSRVGDRDEAEVALGKPLCD